MRHLAAEQLLSPAVQQPAADAMLACHFRRRQIRPQAFRDDLALLLERPNTASLAAGDDLDPRHTSTLTTYRTSILSGVGPWNQSRCCVHGRLPSQHGPVPFGAAASVTHGR